MVCGRPHWTFSYVILGCALVLAAWMPTDAKSAQATLRWDYTASGAAGFVLYCGTASRNYSTRIDVGNTTSYTIGALAAGTTYYCATTAYDAAKRESAYSSEVTIAVPIAPPSSAPQIISRTPLLGATGVRSGTTVTARFGEAVQQSTISYVLRGPSGATVPATVTYDPLSLTAELQPLAALAASTTYTATLTGAKDVAGTAMTAPVTWTFTTAAAQVTCNPCTIWPSNATPAVTTASDTASVELGVKFRVDVNGWISGIRFYKSSLNTGTHIGSLWTAGGDAAGYCDLRQRVHFRLATGQLSRASRSHCRHHVCRFLSCKRRTLFSRPRLFCQRQFRKRSCSRDSEMESTAPMESIAYNTAVAFPTNTYLSSNYWVDVVFTAGALNCPCTLWPATAVPAVADYPDTPQSS